MDKITHAMRRKYWENIVNECCSSGEPKNQWLIEHNINEKMYYRWQKKLRMEAGTEIITSQISAPVNIQNITELQKPVEKPTESSGKAAVLRSGNLEIDIQNDISDELLIKLIKAMSNA